MNYFNKHLHDVNESYFTHFKHAMYFCVYTFFASVALLFHATLPFLFTTTGSRIITNLYNLMSVRAKIASKQGHNRVAIIGFGASGIATFCNIVRGENASHIDIFDANFLSLGTAYDTPHAQHLLNVKAKGMSILDDEPSHFVNWLKTNGWNYKADDFVPRTVYGIYLKSVVAEVICIAKRSGIAVKFHHSKVENISYTAPYFVIMGDVYAKCYLCIGAEFLNKSNNFWCIGKDELQNRIANMQEISIVGTGLSAFDAVFTVASLELGKKIVLYSRSGELSQPHEDYDQSLKPQLSADSFSIHDFIALVKNAENWRAVIDAVRPITQTVWQGFCARKKKIVMKYLFRYWNKYRHRSPVLQYNKIIDMINNGMVELRTQKPPHGAIYCTGFDLTHFSALEQNLMQNAIVKKDDIAMGLVSLHDGFRIIGAKNFGSLFETTAIPEIRKQSAI